MDVDSISENEVIFSTRVFIEKYSSCLFKLTDTISFYATIVEVKKSGKDRKYRGLIHSLGEEEKKALRKFIFAKD